MRNWKGMLPIIVIQLLYLLGCESGEKRVRVEPKLVEKEVSCTFNQLDGECRVYDFILEDRQRSGANNSLVTFIGVTNTESGGSTAGEAPSDSGEMKVKEPYSICSMGTCSDGDCENGKGILSFPRGSKIEGTFKKGKLNGTGSYEGCGSSYTGTFKDNLKDKGVLIIKTKLNRDRELIQYYDGLFQNEMRNGKGIYYSSSDSNIYEGSWKDDVKNGAFVVYSNFRGDFPLSEKGAVMKTVYDGSKKITYVNDRDKEEVEQEERDRKYREIQDARMYEEERKQELRQAQYEREQKVRQKKYEAERNRAYQACQATRSRYSPQCEDFNRRYYVEGQ